MDDTKHKPVKVTAKFTGRNGSNGFSHGHTYNLEVEGSTVRAFNRPDTPYESVAAFLRNWTNIKA